jgi:hypothetical protein
MNDTALFQNTATIDYFKRSQISLLGKKSSSTYILQQDFP